MYKVVACLSSPLDIDTIITPSAGQAGGLWSTWVASVSLSVQLTRTEGRTETESGPESVNIRPPDTEPVTEVSHQPLMLPVWHDIDKRPRVSEATGYSENSYFFYTH